MKQKVNRDWEMIRIFLILGLMTLGFVLVVQGLTLTPATRPRTQDYNQLESELLSMESHKDGAALGKIGILPGALSPSLPKLRIPLKPQSDPSKSSGN